MTLDLASWMVKLHCSTAAERALIPAFVFFFFMLYPPAWIAGRRHKTAGAAGGCMLIRSSALARIGGISAIRSELIDDCALARAVKLGGRIWLGVTENAHSVRPYDTFAEIGRMISRSAFTELRHSAWLLAATILGMAVIYLAPPAPAADPRFACGVARAGCVDANDYFVSSHAAFLPKVARLGSVATADRALLHRRDGGFRTALLDRPRRRMERAHSRQH